MQPVFSCTALRLHRPAVPLFSDALPPAFSAVCGPRLIHPLQAETRMLYYAVVFLVIALIAGALGFFGIAGAAAGIAKILFVVFLVLFVLSLIFGRRRV